MEAAITTPAVVALEEWAACLVIMLLEPLQEPTMVDLWDLAALLLLQLLIQGCTA
jgi:hypothetical protein